MTKRHCGGTSGHEEGSAVELDVRVILILVENFKLTDQSVCSVVGPRPNNCNCDYKVDLAAELGKNYTHPYMT